MNITQKIEFLREKRQATDERMKEHESFVEMFIHSVGKAAVISTGFVSSAQLNAKEIQTFSQDSFQDKIEVVQEKPACPVYLRVNEIDSKVTGYQELSDFMHKHNKAAYYPNYDHIVCETFNISDENAYKIGNSRKNPHLDFQSALGEFTYALSKAKYTGKMPKTLEDVEKLLDSGLVGLKEKQQEKIRESAAVWGLDGALKVREDVRKENNKNTTSSVVTHEEVHANNRDVLKKGLLPSTLVSPSGLFLLYAADEVEAQLNGRTGDKAAEDAVRAIRNTQSTRYGENWFNNVENHLGTIKTLYKQKLDVNEDGTLVDNFSAENYQKLLKEMIPDDATRETVQKALNQLKKDKLILDNTMYEVTYYDNLRMNHNMFIRNLDPELVQSTKMYASLTDEEAKGMEDRRVQNHVKEYGSDHFENLVDVSNKVSVKDGKLSFSEDVNDFIKASKKVGKTFSAEKFLAMAAEQGR